METMLKLLALSCSRCAIEVALS
uniref:Uncharacterized protein n=1 Tax=Arundo donax TaxID=35708 RepID=A0A0A9AGP7_ARUDO